jgi:clan AA aspartic protease (TIGR02281 family)
MTFRIASVGFSALCISAGLLLRQQEPREPQHRFDPADTDPPPLIYAKDSIGPVRPLTAREISGSPPNPLLDGLLPPAEANPWPGTVGWHAPASKSPEPSSDAPPLPPKSNSEVKSDTAPPLPPEFSSRAFKIAGNSYGQFWTDCRVNGAAFRCLVDTGADAVSFGRRDAERVGINVKRLNFDGLASTANGKIQTASTRIAKLEVGPFRLSDVPVRVFNSEMDMPLLGMAFLRRFKLTVGGDTLTISE